MLLVVEKMRFLKIILSITFFNMENLNKIVKNTFFREKIIAFFHGKNVFFWKKYFLRGGDKNLFLKIFTWEIYFW